jgi:hypothetical protein
MRNINGMPVGLSPVSISRIVAGILAALWAMAGLANDYVALASVGPSADVIIAVATNVFLIAGASLAFVNARSWRLVLLIALVCVTADRIVSALGSGAAFQQTVSAAIAFVAIASVTLVGSAPRR